MKIIHKLKLRFYISSRSKKSYLNYMFIKYFVKLLKTRKNDSVKTDLSPPIA